ncbi:MAG: hypothetical protein WDM94_10030 [Bauldia sp.]
MNATLRLLVLGALAGALASPALAEDRQTTGPGAEHKTEAKTTDTPAAPNPVMRDLLNDGYVILQATYIPHDAVKRAGSTVDVDAMMFLLTKGTQVATCYTDLQSYTNGSFVTLACNEYK